VPARRSRQSLFHRVEDLFRHVALGKERELDRLAALSDDRDAIRGNFEPRAGLERVVQDDEIEGFILQFLARLRNAVASRLESAPTKRPRGNGKLSVQLEATPDILASLKRPRGCVMVGFALETGDGLAKAQRKLQDKRLDFVVLNDALEPGAGFAVATNKVTILRKDGAPVALPLLSKRDVAERILDAVEQALT